MDCGKICLTRTKAAAHALASPDYRRAYWCLGCRAWHTTSQPLAQERPLIHSPKISHL